MDKRLVKKSVNKNIDSELEQLNDIVTHKKFIMDSAGLLCRYFIKNNNLDMALETLKVSFAHDISKSNKDEFLGFSHMITEDDKNKVIKLHYERNKHHPEFWDDIKNIDEITMIEMSIDFFARSLQFKTDPVEYVIKENKKKFNFPKNILSKIINYLNIMKKENKK